MTHKPDYLLLFITFVLVVFGLVMISSASVVSSQNDFGDAYYYLKHQILNGFIPGLIGFFIVQRVPYLYFKKWALPLFIANVGLLLLVFMPALSGNYGGARSWVEVGPISFQPSELLKLTFIVYLASWFSSHQSLMKDFKQLFIPFVILLGLLSTLLILQPDLGTLGLVVIPSVIVYFLAGGSLKYIMLIGAAGAMSLLALIKVAPYRLNRLLVFLDPKIDPLGIGYQINQALLAIGSGGVFGLGLGHSRQKFNYLPEVQGDSIFAIIGEELGLVGALFVVGMFIWLMIQCFKVARNAPDHFSQLAVYGIASWIVIQALVNIGANLSLLPLTGVPLPFISYGGTALAVAMTAMGVVLNISRETKG